VVAIGTFDGVHRGHQALLARAIAHAQQGRPTPGEAVALTFAPHPATVVAPERAPPALITLSDRIELMGAAGLSVVICEPFDRALAARAADWFVDELLVRTLGVREVVVGADFTYGCQRQGTVETLRRAAERHGFVATVVEPVLDGGDVISSTRVRQVVAAGDVEGAERLLGRPFHVRGRVVRGDGRGRTIGMPTANVRPEPVYADGAVATLLPLPGVYAGLVTLRATDGMAPDAPRHAAVVNLGSKPTFVATGALTLEAHLLDGSFELLGQSVRVELLSRLRNEQRFPSSEALVAQIRSDIDAARTLLRRRRVVT
jgi:riboflavin kinase/FMN adenylyltransferase